MRAIFKPSVSLMNKLRYPKKLFLLGSIAALVVGILSYQLVIQSMNILEFSHRELLGTRYINPLVKVLQQIQNYRQLETEYLQGDQKVRDRLGVVRAEVDKAIALVDDQDANLGMELKTTSDWNGIKNSWNLVTTQAQQDNLKSDVLGTYSLITNIQQLIIKVCDTSNLTLDPDLDSYYLMDNYCTKIPSFIVASAEIRNLGSTALTTKAVTEDNKQQLIILKTLMDKINKESIKNNLRKVLIADSYLSPNFEPIMQSLYSQSTDLYRMVDRTILANNFTSIAPEAQSALDNKLVNTAYKLYEETDKWLSHLLQVRVDKISNALYMNAIVASLGLLFLIYLFGGMYLSIVNSIDCLVQGSEQIARGDLVTSVALDTQDELVQVASSFNLMRTNLSKIINELHAVVSSAVIGDLTKSIDLSDKVGFSHELSLAINKVSDAFQIVISETIHVLDNVSRGVLTERITKDYQGSFGDLKIYVNKTAESLESLIKEIKIATETINHGAKEIVLGNNDLAKRTEQQAAFLEETSASIEQLTSTVKQNAENAKQANHLSLSASGVAIKGVSVVGEVVSTMTTINDSSRKVADIISVIDEIAFQTNILALNAAVEAARAGEQGRGFGVVAAEVRNLALRTSAAAKEIKLLIIKSVENVTDGTKLVDQAGKTMEEIVKAVNQVTNIMSEIASASVEQSDGIEQVNIAISQMDQVTQQNTTLVEEAAHAAQSMEVQTTHMDALVEVFKLGNASLEAIQTNEQNIGAFNNAYIKKAKYPIIPSKESIIDKRKNENWDEF